MEPELVLDEIIGDSKDDFYWNSIYKYKECPFNAKELNIASLNLICNPNINSTSIMRADILYDSFEILNNINTNNNFVNKNFDLINPIQVKLLNLIKNLPYKRHIIRDIIPRNHHKDSSLVQSCYLLSNSLNCLKNNKQDDINNYKYAIIYFPHVSSPDLIPYYHPIVRGVMIYFQYNTLYLYYSFFSNDNNNYHISQRLLRTGLRLINTSYKHAKGTKEGYEKRVNHDKIVNKIKFQSTYIRLKDLYSSELIKNWVEVTDPKKHVYEDLSIASFLIEMWNQNNLTNSFKNNKKILDLGCGNGILVYILSKEGYNIQGIDARRRKSWDSFPIEIKSKLHEKIILPKILFNYPELDSSQNKFINQNNLLKSSPNIYIPEPKNFDFIIGNHSDELSLWIPLLGSPFIVIPCCSHLFSGKRFRFKPKSKERKSTYCSLVDTIIDISKEAAWDTEIEMLRIPSTRNTAIIGRTKLLKFDDEIVTKNIISKYGGADGWIENSMQLCSQKPRVH